MPIHTILEYECFAVAFVSGIVWVINGFKNKEW